ncbi:MAG: hypothetical protein OES57_11140, partial [Acidimicrobiia bacterium]|nr:hypothetical protein [Acidimicrobiia bacterium]
MSLNRKLLLLVVVGVGVVVAGWFLLARALVADARDEAHADLRRAARSQTTLVAERVVLMGNRFDDIASRLDAEESITQELLDEVRGAVRDVQAIGVIDDGSVTTTPGGFEPVQATRAV